MAGPAPPVLTRLMNHEGSDGEGGGERRGHGGGEGEGDGEPQRGIGDSPRDSGPEPPEHPQMIAPTCTLPTPCRDLHPVHRGGSTSDST